MLTQRRGAYGDGEAATAAAAAAAADAPWHPAAPLGAQLGTAYLCIGTELVILLVVLLALDELHHCAAQQNPWHLFGPLYAGLCAVSCAVLVRAGILLQSSDDAGSRGQGGGGAAGRRRKRLGLRPLYRFHERVQGLGGSIERLRGRYRLYNYLALGGSALLCLMVLLMSGTLGYAWLQPAPPRLPVGQDHLSPEQRRECAEHAGHLLGAHTVAIVCVSLAANLYLHLVELAEVSRCSRDEHRALQSLHKRLHSEELSDDDGGAGGHRCDSPATVVQIGGGGGGGGGGGQATAFRDFAPPPPPRAPAPANAAPPGMPPSPPPSPSTAPAPVAAAAAEAESAPGEGTETPSRRQSVTADNLGTDGGGGDLSPTLRRA